MVRHGGRSAGSYLADPTSPIPSHCTSIVVTSTVRDIYISLSCFQCCHACSGGSSHDHGGDNYDTIDAGSDRNSYVHQNPSYDTAGGKTNDTFEY